MRISDGEVLPDWVAFHEYINHKATALAKIFVLAEMLMDDEMMDKLRHSIVDLRDKIFFLDGKEQPAAIPAEALRALFQGLPDYLDSDDPRLAIAYLYNMYGTDHGTELSDHMKVLRASVESMPVEFLRMLIFDLYENRPPMNERDLAQEQIKKKDKEIKRLETRISELENRG